MSHAIPLHSFQEALEKHIDQSKPDPLARKQVEAWNLNWRQDHDVSSTTDVLIGCLEIHGDYVIVTIESHCSWTSPNHGTLDFTLRARARFAPKKKGLDKTSTKIRTGIMKRLREDDYVKPLLESKEGMILCEAHILSDNGELEERVLVDENVVEGLRRSIYSQAEDNLSVMELLMSLPYLPCDNNLAHRAKLRILEDAMVDECVNEEENELLDDLTIQKQDRKDNEGDAEVEQPSERKKRR